MKGTESFRKTIKEYLDKRAENDSLFAVSYSKESKNIEDCITYILNEVKKSGCCGFDDSEIYGMAVHYYDEDDLSVGEPIKCNVVVNHTVELTEEEKLEARRMAVEKYRDDEIRKMKERNKPKKVEKVAEVQPSLFDF